MPSNGYRMPKEKALQMIKDGTLKVEKDKVPVLKRYLQNEGKVPVKDVWSDIKSLQNNENLKYPTQKPENSLKELSLPHQMRMISFLTVLQVLEQLLRLQKNLIGNGFVLIWENFQFTL